ncbi:hypothetical protein M0D69_03330 [Caballeronia sp. SEWSISQ10-4 2]|uniref:hypothetical protein n=1 Tax=Caballeronia sp. SEWSISQ10-4 2 TaxID=2937438 RepID=UPI00264F9007|nr:hypothetical protein [Caballeronia sp. SEWSISQ10-4 2]MDN7177060.1 hypothetical protein [Caballeronia sp. SEWSISQ10-4 2]
MLLQLTGKGTTPKQLAVFNAILIMLVEHPRQLDATLQPSQGATSSVSGRRHA